jgi:hypothetical protein
VIVVSPDEISGGAALTSGMFSLSHSAAARFDSSAPAWSSQTVIDTVPSEPPIR